MHDENDLYRGAHREVEKPLEADALEQVQRFELSTGKELSLSKELYNSLLHEELRKQQEAAHEQTLRRKLGTIIERITNR